MKVRVAAGDGRLGDRSVTGENSHEWSLVCGAGALGARSGYAFACGLRGVRATSFTYIPEANSHERSWCDESC